MTAKTRKPNRHQHEGVYTVADEVTFRAVQGNATGADDTYAECGPAEYGTVDNRLYERQPKGDSPSVHPRGEGMVKNVLYDPMPAAQLRERESLKNGTGMR